MSDAPVGVPTCYRHPDRETYISCQRCGRPICPDCMHEASVGFHCPSCVAEARKSVRTARTTYGGAPSANPGATSLVLIGINAVVWVAIMASGRYASRLYELFALAPKGRCADESGGWYPFTNETACRTIQSARWAGGAGDGAVWQLMTSVFTHVEPWHIGFNMLALWTLGPQLEQLLGRARYLALYLISGLAGSVAVLWLSAEHGTTVGASGAIFGLIGALLVIGFKMGAEMQGLLMWFGINLLITFVVPNVSWQGHLGGLAGGAAIAAILVYAPRRRRTTVQVAGLTGLVVVLLAAAAVRILTL